MSFGDLVAAVYDDVSLVTEDPTIAERMVKGRIGLLFGCGRISGSAVARQRLDAVIASAARARPFARTRARLAS